MALKEMLAAELMKVFLANKDQYIELAKDAIIEFVGKIQVPSSKEPAVGTIVAKLQLIAATITEVYALIKELVDEFGHPSVPAVEKK